MQGPQVFGQLPIGEGREVLALLPQKGLQAIERRLVSPAGVVADAGPDQRGGGRGEDRPGPGTDGQFFDGGGWFYAVSFRGVYFH